MEYIKDFKEFFRKLKLEYKDSPILGDLNVLLQETLKVDYTGLVLKTNLSKSEYAKIQRNLSKREVGEPVNKIFHNQEFFGLNFFVNNNVLAPRQDTEVLVETALKVIGSKPCTVLDLCTGSGCVAISIKKNSPQSLVYASDISEKVLFVAKKNSKKLNCDICFIKSNLFDKIKNRFDVIVSNPPYIKTSDISKLEIEVKNYDPIISLDGGEDGLLFYKEIISKSKNFLTENGYLIFEIGYNQGEDVLGLMKENGFEASLVKDYNNLDRVIIGKNISR